MVKFDFSPMLDENFAFPFINIDCISFIIGNFGLRFELPVALGIEI
jgi:hypothetical protein